MKLISEISEALTLVMKSKKAKTPDDDKKPSINLSRSAGGKGQPPHTHILVFYVLLTDFAHKIRL